MGMVKHDDVWHLPDRLWAQMERFCHHANHTPWVAIIPSSATGQPWTQFCSVRCRWNALIGTGICSSRLAHRRFQEWVAAGVFEAFWMHGLLSAAVLRESTAPGCSSMGPWPKRRWAGLCLDKGYDYAQILHIRSCVDEVQHKQAGQRARYWVVECTHSWLNRFRGLLILWSKKAMNPLAFLHLACGIITWRSLAY